MVINKKITQLDNRKTEKDSGALISKQDVFIDTPSPRLKERCRRRGVKIVRARGGDDSKEGSVFDTTDTHMKLETMTVHTRPAHIQTKQNPSTKKK